MKYVFVITTEQRVSSGGRKLERSWRGMACWWLKWRIGN